MSLFKNKKEYSDCTLSEKIVVIIVAILLISIVVAAIVGLSIGFTGLVFYGICWAFNLAFCWKYVIGIWLILILLNGLIIKIKEV